MGPMFDTSISNEASPQTDKACYCPTGGLIFLAARCRWTGKVTLHMLCVVKARAAGREG
jgi:hypothetical protein